MTLINSDNDPVNPIRALISPTVSLDLVDVLCQSAIGMAKEEADKLIRAGKPALINADRFKAAFRTFVQTNNLPGYLTSFAAPPPPGDVEAMLSTRPAFVRQLELISATDDDCVRAVSDFLRTSADKSFWAEAGLIFDESLRDWDDQLQQRHALIAGEIADMHSDKDAAVRGRSTYRQCRQIQPPLEGRVVPGHFVHGCFNDLADRKVLGWHPEYVALLDHNP